MGKVQVSIRDGRPVSPRRPASPGKAADGKLYAPPSSYVFNARMATGLQRFFLSTPVIRRRRTVGKLVIEAHKGFEYWPSRQEVEIRENETANVTITLKPHADLAAKGWYNGSTHVHMNYGGNVHNTPENLLMTANAQGMHIVSSLVANKDNRILDWQYFRPGGREHPASNMAERSLLVFGEENRPPFWGHTFYIGLRDHLISPFMTGYEGTGLDSLFPNNTELFRKARAQNAATGYVHAFGGEADPLSGKGIAGAKGYGVDVALGTIDALEWSAASRGSLIPLHHAWNNDFHITPVGGEDSLANMQDNRPVGIIRTYAYLGSNFTVAGWVDAIKKGNTFLTSGPVVEFQVNGKMPGDNVKLPAPGVVSLQGQVWSSTPITLVRIYHNGRAWKDLPIPGKTQISDSLSKPLCPQAAGSRSLSKPKNCRRPRRTSFAQAVTNAVRVYVGESKIRSRESAEYFLRWIERLRSEISDLSLWRSEVERARTYRELDEAARIYIGTRERGRMRNMRQS